jgi:hypothetical protein
MAGHSHDSSPSHIVVAGITTNSELFLSRYLGQ